MSLKPSALDQALLRLNESLHSLEEAVTQQKDLYNQSKSALKQTKTRMERLQHANKEVSYRLIKAMETIRVVLDRSHAKDHADH